MEAELREKMRALIDKAKAIQKRVDECEAGGGHRYRVQGFSLIAHPECQWRNYPYERDLSKIRFSSYYCLDCGNRVSQEEVRAYQKARDKAYTYLRDSLIDLFGEDQARELFPDAFSR